MNDDLSPRLPKLTILNQPLASLPVPTLVVGVFEGKDGLSPELRELDAATGGHISRIVESGDFPGKLGETALFFPDLAVGPRRICMVGLGNRSACEPSVLKSASAAAARRLAKLGVSAVALPFDLAARTGIEPPRAAREVFSGAALGGYSFSILKKNNGEKKPIQDIIICGDPAAMKDGPGHGRIIADSVYLARDLANTPANLMTPTMLAERARAVAEKTGLTIEILEKEAIERLGMGGLLGVARGSSEPPVLIVLSYLPTGREKHPVLLVGKGITFDSGGISLKPAENMDKMKTDMSGAAAVIGVIAAAARMKLSAGIIAVIPATENMPGPGAVKPGDVLTALDRATIEVISTDAEGRLILADGIGYAQRYNPSLIIDIATLTGSAVVALGRRVAALFSSSEELSEEIRDAAGLSGERVWPMPLFDHYFDQIKSDIADLKNSAGREGGSSTAAAFLKRFVGDKTPWAHLDIAGTARAEKDYDWVSKGATGWGVMTLTEFIERRQQR